MKILFVTMKYEHKNDMHINNVMAFMDTSEVDFYGPGYTPECEIEKGIAEYVKRNGKYDAIILDFALMLLQNETMDIREVFHWHRYALSDYRIHSAIRYADEMIDGVCKIDTTKIIYYWQDTFTFKQRWEEMIQKLLNKGFYFWGPGEEFFPFVADEEYLRKANASNGYRDFCINNTKKIISMCHATINYVDGCMVPLNERKYDITIPGNLDRFHYPERARIEDKVKTSNLKLYDSYINRTMGYLYADSSEYNNYKREEDRVLADKLANTCTYMEFQQSRESVAMWRENYNVALRNSKFGYACGAVSQQILRKFAEIPSRGAMLLCANIPPLSNYGFRDGENAVVVTPENVLDKCDYFLKHMDEMQYIADQGRKMIYKKHTALAQSRMILSAIECINRGEFNGSRWENGDFVFL